MITYRPNMTSVDTTNYTSQIKAAENVGGSFIASKNSDGRQGFWLINESLKYKILFAKSGTTRFFLENLTEQELDSVSDRNLVKDVSKRRVLIPKKPEHISIDKLQKTIRVLNRWGFTRTKSIKKVTRQRRSTSTSTQPIKKSVIDLIFIGEGKKLSAAVKKQLLNFLEWTAAYYNITRTIRVEIKGGKKNSRYYGAAYRGSRKIICYTNAHRFSRDNITLYDTLSHEMTHFHQYDRGALSHVIVNDRWATKWNGKIYKKSPSNSEWEVEAEKAEKILIDKYFKNHR